MTFITGGQQTQHDDSPSNPQPAPDQPSQVESISGDSSGPLFSMYSKAAEEEDNRMVERWQKDADGILIFVSPRIANPCRFVHNLEHNRPVYSLLRSPHSSR